MPRSSGPSHYGACVRQSSHPLEQVPHWLPAWDPLLLDGNSANFFPFLTMKSLSRSSLFHCPWNSLLKVIRQRGQKAKAQGGFGGCWVSRTRAPRVMLSEEGSPLPSIPVSSLSLTSTGTAAAHLWGASVWDEHVWLARKVLALSSSSYQLLLSSPPKGSRFGCCSKLVSGG